jgi:methionyl-tRNA formyltransferase
MAEAVDAGDVVGRNFVDIADDDTARTLYEKTRAASVDLFEEHLPRIVSGSVEELRTPQDEFEGPRYFYAKDSLDGRKRVPAERLASDDPDEQRATYDLIRALDFPPFEPAYTTIDGHRIRLTASWFERQ